MSQPSANWPEVALEEYVDLLTGHPFKSKQFSDDKSDVPLLRGDNVGQGFLRWESAKRWDADQYDDFAKFHLEQGDVILAMDRPWITAGLKYAWISERDLPALLVQRVARMRGHKGLYTGYLRYLIGSPEFTDHVLSIITGVNVPHISARDIKSFKFRLPPLPTQQRIAAVLSTYDDLIEINTRRIAILEEMARRLYEEWFVHFRFPGFETAEFDGDLPRGWSAVELQDLVQVNPRTPVPRDGFKPFVPMGSLSETSMVIDAVEKRDGNSGTKFQNADTLVARITPCLENGKTGFVDFLDDVQPVAFGSTEFIVFRPLILGPCAIYCLARSHAFRDVAIRSMSGAEGRQRVRPESVQSFPMAHPPQEFLDRFEAIAAPMFSQISALARQNTNLRAQRDLLLPKLVSGEIDVSEAETALEAAE